MVDYNNIAQILHINGITEKSAPEEIERILTALKYSPEDKNRALELLKSHGWLAGAVIAPPVVNPVISPTIPAPGSMNVMPVTSPVVTAPKKASHTGIIWSSVILLIVIGAFLFMYVDRVGVFAIKSYSESNFLSSLIEKSSGIKTSSYKLGASIAVGPRDTGAVPFTVDVTNQAVLREKYQNDYTRVQNISAIMNVLRSKLPSAYNKTSLPLPSTLSSNLFKDNSYYSYSNSSQSVNDPVTNAPYTYAVTDNGKNFKLGVTFQTSEAVNAIKKSYGFIATTTIISGLNVTFTKDSASYLYISSEPPVPFFVQMSNYTSMISPDTSASVAMSASSDLTNEAIANWIFNLDAEGSFGDLTYKVNIDALKKDDNYYLRVNNIPSLFGLGLGVPKGEWVRIPTATTSTSTTSNLQGGELSYISSGLPSFEKSYKEQRQKSVDFIKTVASIADEEKLIRFKKAPVADNVGGRNLLKYDLSIRKEAIVPFYTKLSEAINNDPNLKDYQSFVDQGLIEYLQSPEFNQVFDYYDSSTDLLFWTDENGFPAIAQETLRIVPPDTADQLKGKQVNLVFRLELSKINQSVDIQAPASSTSLEDVVKNLTKQSYGNNMAGLAEMRADLANLRPQAALSYDSNNSSYGKTPFSLGTCSQKEGTLFGDSKVYSYIQSAEKVGGGHGTCVSKGTTNKVASYAVSIPLADSPIYSWCVDSLGNSKQITGVITSDICK